MTFTAKGVPKRDLCVYLTEKEYEELEKLIPQINEILDSTVPQTKKTFMKAYQWTLVSMRRLIWKCVPQGTCQEGGY